jgi:hypothetical protein
MGRVILPMAEPKENDQMQKGVLRLRESASQIRFAQDDICGRSVGESLGKEVHWFQADGAPAGGRALEFKAHLSALASLGRQCIAGFGIHFNISYGKADVLVCANLKKLIAEFDVIVQAQECSHLLAKIIVIRHILRIKDRKQAAEIVGLESPLEIAEDIAHDLVGQVKSLGG